MCLVFYELGVVLAALAAHEHTRVVSRARHHAEYLAGARLNGHHRAAFAHHERLGVFLQFYVEAQFQVAARHGSHVLIAVVEAALDASVGIADEYFLALDAAQMLFVAFFHAKVAAIVARRVIIVFLYVFGRCLAYVAEHVCRRRVVILAQDALLDKEARKTVKFLLQAAIVLGREMRQETLGGVR